MLLDLTMPGMTGDEVLAHMHELDPSVPVVMTSGFDEEDTLQGLPAGALAGFLQKPVRLADLRERLRTAVAGRA